MKKRRKTIAAVIIVLAAFWLLHTFKLLPSLNLFSAKPVIIDETPVLIKEIKSIGQLITYTSFDEVVVDSTAPTRGSGFVNAINGLSPVKVLPSADKQIVLIGRGKVLAGINLALMNDSSIQIKNDTLILFLPRAAILDAILNPSDFETFVETGAWSNYEVTQVKVRARNKMIARALAQNILPKATAKARAVMVAFFENAGYKKVIIF